MKHKVVNFIFKFFEKASWMRTGGVLSLALLSAMILAPPPHASADTAAAMVIKIRPRDIFHPAPITDRDAAVTATEGEVLLQGTAPDPDNLPTGNGPPVTSYFIR